VFVSGHPRIRGWCISSKALNNHDQKYDKGDTHKQNRPPGEKNVNENVESSCFHDVPKFSIKSQNDNFTKRVISF